MNTFDTAELATALLPHRIPDDAVVMVHSSLIGLGPMRGVPLRDLPSVLLSSLREILGPDVTLVVPTFTFTFCDGEPFDRQQTPSSGMGVLAEELRRHPSAWRSPHPIQSIAALGPMAAKICDRRTESAYGPGSSFESLLYLDAYLLLLGCSFEALSLVHLLEERQGVPYRYWMTFEGLVRDGSTEEIRTARHYARKRGHKVHVSPIAHRLHDRGQIATTPLATGQVQSCRALHFAREGLDLLRENSTALLRHIAPPRQSAPHGP